MNTTANTLTSTRQQAMSNVQNKSYTPRSGALASVAGAAVLTLAMLLGVNTLAAVDAPAPQMAQGTSTHA